MADYKIIYTDKGVKHAAKTFYPFPMVFGIGTPTIHIKLEKRDVIGLKEHEIIHCKQYKRKWFHAPMYSLSKEYRLESELEAYSEQIRLRNYKTKDDVSWIVDSLYHNYKFKDKFSKEYILNRCIKIINNNGNYTK